MRLSHLKFLSFLVLITISPNLYGQSNDQFAVLGLTEKSVSKTSIEDQEEIAAALSAYSKIKRDTSQLNFIFELIEEIESPKLKQGLFLEYIKRLELQKDSKKYNDWYGQKRIKAYIQYAIFLFYSGEADEAEKYYIKSIKLSKTIKNEEQLAIALNNLGTIYSKKGLIDKAINSYEESIRIRIKIDDKKGLAANYNNLAGLYYEQEFYEEALEYFEKTYRIDVSLKDSISMSVSLLNISVAYEEMGELDKSLDALTRSYEICDTLDFKPGMAMALMTFGKRNFGLSNYANAEQNYLEALEISRKIDYSDWISQSLHGLADIYYATNRYNLAYEKGIAALKLVENSNYKKDQRDISETLYKIEKARGNDNSALNYLESVKLLNDSITKNEFKKAAIKSQYKQDYMVRTAADSVRQEEVVKIKNLEISKGKQQRNYIILVLGIVSVFGFLMFNRFRVTNKQKKIISKERNKSDDLLLNILPQEVAEELKTKGSTEPKLYDSCTIIFTDFSGFTKISEKLSPQELVLILDKVFLSFDNIIEKHGLSRIKTIGDAYMCVGGLPSALENHPSKAVEAAIEMRDFIEGFNRSLNANEPLWNLRIGVHTGSVVAGVVGIKKFAFDIWGDTVNVASRMESSGEIKKINISGETMALIGDQFEVEFRGKVEAKNKGKIDMYFVERKQ